LKLWIILFFDSSSTVNYRAGRLNTISLQKAPKVAECHRRVDPISGITSLLVLYFTPYSGSSSNFCQTECLSQRKVVKSSLGVKVVFDLLPDSRTGLKLSPISEAIHIRPEGIRLVHNHDSYRSRNLFSVRDTTDIMSASRKRRSVLSNCGNADYFSVVRTRHNLVGL
jgi:hypothetical protein